MTEATSLLAGTTAAEGLAPDIAGCISMALTVVERLRAGLAEKLAAFADVPEAFRPGWSSWATMAALVPRR